MFVHPLLRQIRPVISILETFGPENSPQVSLIFARPAWIFATLLSMVDTKNTRLKKVKIRFHLMEKKHSYLKNKNRPATFTKGFSSSLTHRHSQTLYLTLK